MRQVERKKSFLNDLSRTRRPDFVAEIDTIVYYLQRCGELPQEYEAHPLSWQWSGFWDVHLDDDWILVYRVTNKKVRLIRIVTHKQLGKAKP